MKRYALALVALLALAAPAQAQIRLGLGLAVPLTARDIVVDASVDSAGVVHVNRTLDSSPQLLVEIHRTYKVNKDLELGPMAGFCPKVDLGMAANTGTQHLIGGGFGLMVTKPVKDKKFINLGVMWLVTQPVQQVGPEWKEGFQAPRGKGDVPLSPAFTIGSVNRLMFVMTISGLF